MATAASSAPPPPPTSRSDVRIYKEISVQPCEGKVLSIPVIEAVSRSSDTFVGQSILQYNPNVQEEFQYRFRGAMRARHPQERFNTIMLSYNYQLLRFCETIHRPGCCSSFCEICKKIRSIPSRFESAYSGTEKQRLWYSSRLAENLEWLLTECNLVLRERFQMCSLVGRVTAHSPTTTIPCANCWQLDPAAWAQSTNGLLELGTLLLQPGFKKHRRIWKAVIQAHLTFACPDLKINEEEFTEQWFTEEMSREQKKAMEDLKNGEYGNLFVYTLFTDYHKSQKLVKFELPVKI